MLGYSSPPTAATPYVVVQDQKPNTTTGGTFTSGAWQTRTLNTVVVDANGIATLANNQVTLPAGTYQWRGYAPAFNTGGVHQARLQNITDGTTVGSGTQAGVPVGQNGQVSAVTTGVFTIAASATFELQHRTVTTRATDGFGLAMSFGSVEVFATLEFWKLA